MANSPPVVCPHCTRRRTMKVAASVYSEAAQEGEIVSWQCVYCGAVCEQAGPSQWRLTHFALIHLQPGELVGMREDRAVKRSSGGQSDGQ